MTLSFNRRSMMRGMLGGAGVVVGIPTLDAFLDGNGMAYADGVARPVRFGTYFWGLGLTHGPNRWVPTIEGVNDKDGKRNPVYDVKPELMAMKGLEQKVSVFSNFRVHLDGKPNVQHHTGQASIMSGVAPSESRNFDLPSFDTMMADEIGGGTRFRSLELTPFGSPSMSYSTRTGKSFSTAEASPISLYTRIFGEGFQDPNSDAWTPSREAMLRRSVLSAVTDQRQALISQVGAADKARLDQYFTSLRQMEEQLATELQKPAKCESCVIPTSPEESTRTGQIDLVNANNRLMANLMAMALACNQTKLFNVVHTSAGSSAYLPGDPSVYHLHTHDEPLDTVLGFQKTSSKLATLHFTAYAEFLHALEAIKEGDGTLLDNTLVFGFSDTGNARVHSTDNIPMFLGGRAGGKHKGGIHINGNGEPVTRVSLTAMQLAGMPIGEFGQQSMKTSKPIREVMA